MNTRRFYLPMRIYWTLFLLFVGSLFGLVLVYNLTLPSSQIDVPPLIIFGAMTSLILILAYRWQNASIVIGPDIVEFLKMFSRTRIDLTQCERFEFVTGRFGFYVYVGAMHGSEILVRSSYGPFQNIVTVQKSMRMSRYIMELNSFLEKLSLDSSDSS